MKILIIKLSSIGDVVHTLPAVASLSKAFPGIKIDWLVEEAASGLLQGHPLLNEVIVVKHHGWFSELGRNLLVGRYLKGKSYNVVLDFQGLFKSGIWVFLSGGSRRVGFSNSRELSHLFLNEKLPAYDIEKHAVLRYLDLARAAGGSPVKRGNEVFRLHYTDEDELKVGGLLSEHGLKEGDPFFAVCAHARWPTKLWSEKCFGEAVSAIEKRFGIRPVIVGSPAEADMAGKIVEAAAGSSEGADGSEGAVGSEGAINLAGKTNLRELSYLLSLARFALTVDSGPMHIAAAAGTPVVALFGPTASNRTGPFGDTHRVIRKDLDCAPCFKKKCADPKCMNTITPEEVADEVGALIASGAVTGSKAGAMGGT